MSGADQSPAITNACGQGIDLRALTTARVSLERTGASVATRPALEFSLAHAQARDAVHTVLNVAPMVAALRERGMEVLAVKSAARGRAEYLRRPDLGRRVVADSIEALRDVGPAITAGAPSSESAMMSIVIADGLSALAVERHAIPLLDALLPYFVDRWELAPVVVAEQARVALGDEIGATLGADMVVVLIGERPGLSAPDSLGAYITWAPRAGRTDAERNCVSNIRAEGLSYAAAAERIAWYANQGERLRMTGVGLREGGAIES